MDLISILLIAVALSMDCVAVAAARGLSSGGARRHEALMMGASFGAFQGVMPIAGWFLGSTFIALISGFDHWVAFALLAFIGAKMIYDSRLDGIGGDGAILGAATLLTLSLATSIDALAVGLSLSFLGAEILLPAATIGVVCFSLTAAAGLVGGRIGELLGARVKLIGGAILILIGLRILIEHLMV